MRERGKRKSDRVKQNWVQKAKLISKLLAGTAKKRRRKKATTTSKAEQRQRQRASGIGREREREATIRE